MKIAAGLLTIAVITLPTLAFPQRFKVNTEAVRVDVLVKDGNRPVGGLSAADFDLRDRGVPQRIDSVSFEDVPLSVMIALDTSDSLKGRALDDLRDAAAAATQLLRPEDRSALLTFTERLWLRAPWTHEHESLHVALLHAGASGATSLHDVAYAALTLKDDRSGRRLVLLLSDGQDTASWLGGAAVVAAARRNDAVVYTVGLTTGSAQAPGYRLDFRSGVQPPVPKVAPVALTEPLLSALAEETGGSFLTIDRSDRLHDTFRQIVTEFRTRYLLTYSPRGVDVGGWHPIEVKLKGRRGSVTARRGYLR
jgi:Ca-activated chloride channel family protein